MSERLERTIQLAKLARLLDVDAGRLDDLAEVSSADLTAFRAQVTDRLFGGDAGMLRRVAAASRLVPIPLIVQVAQLAFGARLCAATAGLLEPDRAAKIAGRTPTTFLADITVHLDPRHSAAVIAAIPSDVVVAVARELLARGEHVTIGRFVSHLPQATLRAAVPMIDDDADLLRVAFVMEGKDALSDLVYLAEGRIPSLLEAARGHDLWPEVLDLMGHLDADQRAELALVAAESDVIAEITAVAIEQDLWLDLLPLAEHLPGAALDAVARHLGELDPQLLERLALQAYAANQLAAMASIADRLTDAARARFAAIAAASTHPDAAVAMQLLTPLRSEAAVSDPGSGDDETMA